MIHVNRNDLMQNYIITITILPVYRVRDVITHVQHWKYNKMRSRVTIDAFSYKIILI